MLKQVKVFKTSNLCDSGYNSFNLKRHFPTNDSKFIAAMNIDFYVSYL